MIKPKKLQPGDKVAAITLSWGGPGTHPHRYEAGKRQLEEEFGVEVVATRHALRDADWLWRNPQARADDLMEVFGDPSIKGIVSTIGGNDSIRLLPYIDLDVIRRNPKVFLGFSDTTVTHLACFKAGLGTFYGPSVMAGFGENTGLFPYMVDAVRRTMFRAEPIGPWHPNEDGWTVEYLDWADPTKQARKRRLNEPLPWRFLQGGGTVRGRLLGGCLEVLEKLRGTDVWPTLEQWNGAVMFLEMSERASPPLVLEDALRSYAAMGVLDKLSAILFARPGGGVRVDKFDEYDAVLHKVVAEEAGRPALPIITRMDFGHTDPVFVLPYGVMVEIDCDNRQITLPDSAVTD